MEFKIEIPEEMIREAVLQIVAKEIAKTYSFEGRTFKCNRIPVFRW